jgi:hypothetical protein
VWQASVLAPSLLSEGEPIHMPDRGAVLDHFAAAIGSYRKAAHVENWNGSRSTFASSVSTPSSPRFTGMRLTPMGKSSETHGRATTCSPLPTGGASSRTQITSEPFAKPPNGAAY